MRKKRILKQMEGGKIHSRLITPEYLLKKIGASSQDINDLRTLKWLVTIIENISTLSHIKISLIIGSIFLYASTIPFLIHPFAGIFTSIWLSIILYLINLISPDYLKHLKAIPIPNRSYLIMKQLRSLRIIILYTAVPSSLLVGYFQGITNWDGWWNFNLYLILMYLFLFSTTCLYGMFGIWLKTPGKFLVVDSEKKANHRFTIVKIIIGLFILPPFISSFIYLLGFPDAAMIFIVITPAYAMLLSLPLLTYFLLIFTGPLPLVLATFVSVSTFIILYPIWIKWYLDAYSFPNPPTDYQLKKALSRIEEDQEPGPGYITLSESHDLAIDDIESNARVNVHTAVRLASFSFDIWEPSLLSLDQLRTLKGRMAHRWLLFLVFIPLFFAFGVFFPSFLLIFIASTFLGFWGALSKFGTLSHGFVRELPFSPEELKKVITRLKLKSVKAGLHIKDIVIVLIIPVFATYYYFDYKCPYIHYLICILFIIPIGTFSLNSIILLQKRTIGEWQGGSVVQIIKFLIGNLWTGIFALISIMIAMIIIFFNPTMWTYLLVFFIFSGTCFISWNPESIEKDILAIRPWSKNRFRVQHAAMIVFLIICLSITSIHFSERLSDSTANIPPDSRSTKLGGNFSDTHFYFNENLVVQSDLYLENCSLHFNDSISKTIGIYVPEDSILHLNNSRVSADHHIGIAVYGTLIMNDSEVTDITGTLMNINIIQRRLNSGICVENGELIIENSTIRDSLSHGIIAISSNVIIRNSTISDCRRAAVWMDQSSFIIEDTSINNAESGVRLYNSSGYLREIRLDYLDDNILLDDFSNVTTENITNAIHGSQGPDVGYYFRAFIILELMMIIPIAITIYMSHRKAWKKLETNFGIRKKKRGDFEKWIGRTFFGEL